MRTRPRLIAATGISPQDDFESAILTALAPGPDAAIVVGTNGGIGVAEVYHLP